jgi:hypothetical protein
MELLRKKWPKKPYLSTAYLAKFVKILKISFVESVPHNLNIHVIQILQNAHFAVKKSEIQNCVDI